MRIYVGLYMINEITRRFSERITDISMGFYVIKNVWSKNKIFFIYTIRYIDLYIPSANSETWYCGKRAPFTMGQFYLNLFIFNIWKPKSWIFFFSVIAQKPLANLSQTFIYSLNFWHKKPQLITQQIHLFYQKYLIWHLLKYK